MSKTVLAIDPGTKTTGYAVFKDGKLTHFNYVSLKPARGVSDCEKYYSLAKSLFAALEEYQPDEVVIEQPHVHATTPNAESIRKLAQFVQALYGQFSYHTDAKMTTYLPATWKGQTEKEVTYAQICKDTLSELQRKALDAMPKYVRLDVSDAIGIGVYHIGEKNKWKRRYKNYKKKG